MDYKKLFTRFVMQPTSEQESALVYAFLERDEEAAAIVCQYDIPEITGIICKNDILATKAYSEKYATILPLYRGMTIDEYIDTVFAYHAPEIIPVLDLFNLKSLLAVYEKRNELIQDLLKQKRELNGQLDKYTEDIKHTHEQQRKPTKNFLEKVDATDKRMKKITSFISLLKASWVNTTEICDLLKNQVTSYHDIQRAKLEALLSDTTLAEHYNAFCSSAPTSVKSENVVALQERIRALEAELSDLRAHCATMHTKVSNLQADKQDAEAKLEQYAEMISRLQDDNGELKANCDAYHSILIGLSSKIANALCKPLSEIERIIFEIEDSTMTPADIANWLKDPVNQLRENFLSIPLNASGFDNLPAEYCIAIDSVDPDDNWSSRTLVPYNEAYHTCKVGASEFVHLRNRGFVYENNLGQEKTIKADAVPCESPATATTDAVEGEN